ncbi:hypothetical protein HDV05_004532 [Chytridiales sp. JEL 0842]|nr:hypothetical protein HDV05_004532 [Chytridiales sp. JEL 0842]
MPRSNSNNTRIISSRRQQRSTLSGLAAAAATGTILASMASTVSAGSACIAVSSTGSLFAFGAPFGDVAAGTQSEWQSQTAFTSLDALPNRPPFNGNSVQCLHSQYSDVIYVMGADSANPSDIHIFDVATRSWSTQKTSGLGDPAYATAILDRNTQVIYAFSNGKFQYARTEGIKTAQSTPINWVDVGNAVTFPTDSYKNVTFGSAKNHLHFLDYPGANPGEAYIFVIHYAYWQPERQSYGSFPNVHGQTATIPNQIDSEVPLKFAYIPDDGSGVFVVDVETNSTTRFPGPASADFNHRYATSKTTLVQLTSAGELNYLDGVDKNGGGQWQKIQNPALLKVASKPSGTAPGGAGGATPTGSGASVTTTTGSKSSASSNFQTGVVSIIGALFSLLVL